MPVFNEQTAVGTVLREWFPALEAQTARFTFLAINDGSTDGTLAVLGKPAGGTRPAPRNPRPPEPRARAKLPARLRHCGGTRRAARLPDGFRRAVRPALLRRLLGAARVVRCHLRTAHPAGRRLAAGLHQRRGTGFSARVVRRELRRCQRALPADADGGPASFPGEDSADVRPRQHRAGRVAEEGSGRPARQRADPFPRAGRGRADGEARRLRAQGRAAFPATARRAAARR